MNQADRRGWIHAAILVAVGVGCELLANLPGIPVMPHAAHILLHAVSSLAVVMAGVLAASALTGHRLGRLAVQGSGAQRAQWLILLAGVLLYAAAAVLRELSYTALNWSSLAAAGWVFIVLTSLLWLVQTVGAVMVGFMLVLRLLAVSRPSQPTTPPGQPAMPSGQPPMPSGASTMPPGVPPAPYRPPANQFPADRGRAWNGR